MRGSHGRRHGSVARSGIIPAHAGLTRCQESSSGRNQDHPRACGAHRLLRILRRACLGSSPRMRGSHTAIVVVELLDGIIPAHAGLTVGTRRWLTFMGDHPRACGAHMGTADLRYRGEGSSPRMRGSPGRIIQDSWPSGIIPAHAGLTPCRRPAIPGRRDHPRACGAHKRGWSMPLNGGGSSPRMRGSPTAFC